MSWPELETLMTDGMAAQGKQIHLYTSVSGVEMISHAFAVENSVGFVKWMEEKKKITSDEATSLTTMLRSKDIENFNIAILAIEQLKK
jgi:hypothetical protein